MSDRARMNRRICLNRATARNARRVDALRRHPG